jgi:indole-3-glycerol phosphate synthase
MSGFLERMARASAARAAAIGHGFAAGDLARPRPALALSAFDVIAEIKPRSPAEGPLAADPDALARRALAYADAGAAAISVLTEPEEFGGSLELLARVVEALDGRVPVMRKDFLVDPRQLDEARAAGAGGVLLIVALTDEARLATLLERAFELDLFVLLESFDTGDLARTAALLTDRRWAARAAAGDLLVGVNARDLRTLAVDPERLAALAPRLPRAAIGVAESGLHDAADAGRAAAAGYRLALVGTALMRAENPGALLREMLAAGRGAAAGARIACGQREPAA